MAFYIAKNVGLKLSLQWRSEETLVLSLILNFIFPLDILN